MFYDASGAQVLQSQMFNPPSLKDSVYQIHVILFGVSEGFFVARQTNTVEPFMVRTHEFTLLVTHLGLARAIKI
jgi:hypothetical protein